MVKVVVNRSTYLVLFPFAFDNIMLMNVALMILQVIVGSNYSRGEPLSSLELVGPKHEIFSTSFIDGIC